MGRDLKGKELGSGICQRKDGLYQARYTDRWGKRKTIYGKNLREIRKELAAAVAGNESFTSVKDEITLDRWFDRWMEIYKEKSIRPNTQREYTHIYRKNISPYIGERLINSLVKSDIQKLIDKASDDNYGYERQNKIKIILKDMLQRALEDDLIVKNPVSGIQLRAGKEINAKTLTVEEQSTFFDYCRNTFYDNLFNVAVNTGLRPGELFALQLSDIDFDNGYIDVNKTLVYQKYLTDQRKEFHVEPPKTKQSYRKVPINSVCRKYLEAQIDLKQIVSHKRPKQQNDYLFVTKFNTPLNSQIYSDAIKAVIRQINLTRPFDEQFNVFSGHTFRHTFATRCFENGVDAKVVQGYLGHASLKMTMDLYTHVTDDKASIDIEKIVPQEESKVVDIRRKMA
ncbi:MAG: tyrosine-type recombinase/integrase [Lachnospiraceae bacterium]|nr:tyrosine-type recombinase/integrase [Lachnospiraceae bacterium]